MSRGTSIFRGLKNLATEKIAQSAKGNLHRLSGKQIRVIIKAVVATKSKDQLESIIGDMIDNVDDEQLRSLISRSLDSGHLSPSDVAPAKNAIAKEVS